MSPLRGEKPDFWPVSKFNTLRGILPVTSRGFALKYLRQHFWALYCTAGSGGSSTCPGCKVIQMRSILPQREIIRVKLQPVLIEQSNVLSSDMGQLR